jgi:hypothetical protein
MRGLWRTDAQMLCLHSVKVRDLHVYSRGVALCKHTQLCKQITRDLNQTTAMLCYLCPSYSRFVMY